MKKQIILLSLATVILFNSCATVLTPKSDTCQRNKPVNEKRKIRAGYLIADLLLLSPVGLAIDFLTCKIYQPCQDKKN